MYAENILATAHAIENGTIPGFGFNMRTWYTRNPAGDYPDVLGRETIANGCMAAWANHVEEGFTEPLNVDAMFHVPSKAGAFFGLRSAEQINDLFQNYPSGTTPRIAAACLRNLVKTGEVNWKKAWDEDRRGAPWVPGRPRPSLNSLLEAFGLGRRARETENA